MVHLNIFILDFYLAHLALGSTGLDKEDVTILDDVFLTLRHDLTLGFHFSFIAKLLKHVEVVHNSLDEGLFEICVNDTSSLRCLDTKTDSPLSDLVSTGSEEAAKAKSLAHGKNNLGQRRLDAQVLALLCGLGLGLELCETLLEAYGEGQDGVTGGVLLHPLGNLGKMLVLLTDEILLGQVDQVDNRLGREQEKRVDDLDLLQQR